jgi:hypothetical protein
MFRVIGQSNGIRSDWREIDSNIWDFGPFDFTIEWIQKQTAPNAPIFNVGITGYPYMTIGCSIGHTGTTQGSDGLLTVTINGASNTVNIGPALNVWAHIVLERMGNHINIYNNGSRKAVIPLRDYEIISNSKYPLYICTYNRLSTHTEQFSGLLINFRITKAAMYGQDFTPISSPLVRDIYGLTTLLLSA